MTKNEREKTKNAMRNNAILNSYFSSFRLASFRYFVFSPGVISSFRYFTWRFFRYFVFSPRHNARRKDEKTKLRHAKRRNNAMRNNENRISCIIDNINVEVNKKLCGPRSYCSCRGSLGYESSLICFYTAGPRGI